MSQVGRLSEPGSDSHAAGKLSSGKLPKWTRPLDHRWARSHQLRDPTEERRHRRRPSEALNLPTGVLRMPWPPCRCGNPSSSASQGQGWIPDAGRLVELRRGGGQTGCTASHKTHTDLGLGSAVPAGAELHPCPRPWGLRGSAAQTPHG